MLALDKISFAHESQQVISSLSLDAKAGAVVVVRGANGSGKTTLLKLIGGLLRADAGAITLRGESPGEGVASLIYLGHKGGLKADLSVSENLRLLAALSGCPSGRPLAAALAEVGLAAKRDVRAGELSAGQRKRACLARLLLCDADVWLLDEPFANLDAAGGELLRRMLSRQAGRGLAVVTTTEPLAAIDAPCREISLS